MQSQSIIRQLTRLLALMCGLIMATQASYNRSTQDPILKAFQANQRQQKHLSSHATNFPWQYYREKPQNWTYQEHNSFISSPLSARQDQDLYREPGKRYNGGPSVFERISIWLGTKR